MLPWNEIPESGYFLTRVCDGGFSSFFESHIVHQPLPPRRILRLPRALPRAQVGPPHELPLPVVRAFSLDGSHFREDGSGGPKHIFPNTYEILIFSIPKASCLRGSIRLVKLVSPLLVRAHNLSYGAKIYENCIKNHKIDQKAKNSRSTAPTTNML